MTPIETQMHGSPAISPQCFMFSSAALTLLLRVGRGLVNDWRCKGSHSTVPLLALLSFRRFGSLCTQLDSAGSVLHTHCCTFNTVCLFKLRYDDTTIRYSPRYGSV